MNIDRFNAATTTSLNRRTILQGAAWTAPVIAVSAAAPAFAASPIKAHFASFAASAATANKSYNFFPVIDLGNQAIGRLLVRFTEAGSSFTTGGSQSADWSRASDSASVIEFEYEGPVTSGLLHPTFQTLHGNNSGWTIKVELMDGGELLDTRWVTKSGNSITVYDTDPAN